MEPIDANCSQSSLGPVRRKPRVPLKFSAKRPAVSLNSLLSLGEDAAQRQMRVASPQAFVLADPHPAFGHLLPKNGEGFDGRHKARMKLQRARSGAPCIFV